MKKKIVLLSFLMVALLAEQEPSAQQEEDQEQEQQEEGTFQEVPLSFPNGVTVYIKSGNNQTAPVDVQTRTQSDAAQTQPIPTLSHQPRLITIPQQAPNAPDSGSNVIGTIASGIQTVAAVMQVVQAIKSSSAPAVPSSSGLPSFNKKSGVTTTADLPIDFLQKLKDQRGRS